MRSTTAQPLLLVLSLIIGLAGSALARDQRQRYSWEGSDTDLSPVLVQPYQLPTATDPARADFLRRMNLEDGVFVRGTRWITRPDVGSRDLFILDITQSLEGGFDSVNLYDKGLLSWGIMQWAARSGSLTRALVFVKRRLWATGRRRLWEKDFVAGGLDVDSDHLIVYGKPMTAAADLRLAFRGTLKVGRFDPKLVAHWATLLARAGRQPAVAALQVEYAGRIVDAVLKKRLAGLPYHAPGRGGLTVADLAANDPYAEALVFALWTNNPRHSWEYVADAARAARAVSVSDDPSLWAPGAFSDALLRRCRASRFGNWQQRAALIEARAQAVRGADPAGLTPFERDYQTVLAARKARRRFELASRHLPKRISPAPPRRPKHARIAAGMAPARRSLVPLQGPWPVASSPGQYRFISRPAPSSAADSPSAPSSQSKPAAFPLAPGLSP